MKIEAGDSVKTLLKLLSVNGEEVPPGSGEQTIHKTVVVGKLYKEALNNFISSN